MFALYVLLDVVLSLVEIVIPDVGNLETLGFFFLEISQLLLCLGHLAFLLLRLVFKVKVIKII